MKPWEVMKAHEEGAEIEWRERGCKEWTTTSLQSPLWNWCNLEYRVKPSPKPPRYVLFTRETWPIGAWVRIYGEIVLPSNVNNYGVEALYYGRIPYKELFDHGKLLDIRDGKVVGERPCGLEVRDE